MKKERKKASSANFIFEIAAYKANMKEEISIWTLILAFEMLTTQTLNASGQNLMRKLRWERTAENCKHWHFWIGTTKELNKMKFKRKSHLKFYIIYLGQFHKHLIKHWQHEKRNWTPDAKWYRPLSECTSRPFDLYSARFDIQSLHISICMFCLPPRFSLVFNFQLLKLAPFEFCSIEFKFFIILS